ncbi:MAG: acetamidase/formamidase family protein [Oscillospiraceae bacterium]|jgi:amidase|nr:acetamidase/formamidase family protein [Oscillospiraceae bacterium]
MRITRDKIYNQFMPGIEPQIYISPGERLTVETLDALFGRSVEDRDGKLGKGYVFSHANPVTGPIYVKGAMPGDALEVEIHDIKLVGRGFLNVPNSGLPTKNTYNGRDYIEVEALSDGNLQLMHSGKIFPASPMIGVIGVAASPEIFSGYFGFSVEAGDHGGNMDNNAIKAGVKAYLPVFAEGALLGIGDIHGIMGDGEVFGQGVEICADVDITVALKKDMKINRPLVISKETISTAASAETMEKASELAISDMRGILEKYFGLKAAEAALAIAFYGNLRVCQIVNSQKTMRMEIRKDIADAVNWR